MKIEPANIIQRLLGTSATLNGVVIPGRYITKAVSRHTLNIFVGEDSLEFPVTLRGSGTAVKFNGKYLLVCTQHQLLGVDRERVGMLTDEGRVFVTSSGMRHYDLSTDTDAFDLVAFDFSDPVEELPELRSRFLHLADVRPIDSEIIAVHLVGYPFDDQLYDLAENNHIGVARRSVTCIPDSQLPSDTALVRVIPTEPLSFKPNGMSGGTAFMIHIGQSGFELSFAGVIVRGGKEAFYLIKPGLVLDFLKSVTKTP